jgi:hypothetical protein
LAGFYRNVADDPALLGRVTEVSARFEELAGAAPEDPSVETVAADIRDLGSRYPIAVENNPDETTLGEGPWAALLATLSAAQGRCLELVRRSWEAPDRSSGEAP